MLMHVFISVGFLNSDYVNGSNLGGFYGTGFVYLDCEDVFKALCGRQLKIV